MSSSPLPDDPAARKEIPLVAGLLDYFPAALIEVAKVSKAGNDQHNPGQPLHWSRDKSTDHEECIARHTIDRGTRDTDGQRHTAKRAWRALAALQLECEADGAPVARGARVVARVPTIDEVLAWREKVGIDSPSRDLSEIRALSSDEARRLVESDIARLKDGISPAATLERIVTPELPIV